MPVTRRPEPGLASRPEPCISRREGGIDAHARYYRAVLLASPLPPPHLTGARPRVDPVRLRAARAAENFPVGSWLLPRPLRLHFARLYAFARTADDLADEFQDVDGLRTLREDLLRHL